MASTMLTWVELSYPIHELLHQLLLVGCRFDWVIYSHCVKIVPCKEAQLSTIDWAFLRLLIII